jgi:polygalacturonase
LSTRHMKNILFTGIFILLLSLAASAKDYNASLFGIKSDGITLNTQSIQKAIDFIHEKGGGKLIFSVGKYLSGSIQLKSNVSIELKEGAVLLATTAIYDYVGLSGNKALIVADGEKNVGIFGKGVIEGQGAGVAEQIKNQIQKGYLQESALQASPAIISMSNCSGIQIEGIHFQNACGSTVNFNQCQQINVQGIFIKNTWRNDQKGLIITACDGAQLNNLFIESSGPEMVLDSKSLNISKEKVKNAAGKML